MTRDQEDVEKIFLWLAQHDLFDGTVKLKLISNGVECHQEGDGINCDEAESIGRKLQESVDNKTFNDCKIKRVDQIKPIAALYNTVKVGKNAELYLDPTILFKRLIAMVQREEDMAKYFQYELTPV